MNTDYILDFTIPQGPTGPTGPQGLQGIQGATGPTGPSDNFVRSFGYLYNQAQIDSIFLPNNQPVQITLPLKSLRANVFYPADNMIGFLSEGAYVVSYSILLQVPSASALNVVTVTANLRLNDTISNPNSLVMVIKDNSPYYITNTIIVNRSANDFIDLVIFADKPVDFSYTSAFICAIKISDLAQP